VSGSNAVDLRVEIGSLSLPNPVIAASGTFGYGVEFASVTDVDALGAIVVKGLSLEAMAGAPPPRMCEVAGGMINAVGLQNIGVRAFVSQKLPLLRKFRALIIANVFGQTKAEYVEVLRVLEDADGIAAYELNVSCPNVEHGGMEFGSDETALGGLVHSARGVARRPLWVKLSPLVTDIAAMASVAERAGADALTVANSYPAMSIDFSSRRSRIGRTSGGLSGPAIKPITLRLVYLAARGVKVPIIGAGGIQSAEDVFEYLSCGASAVQVGTLNFSSPRSCEQLIAGLKSACVRHNIQRIRSIYKTFDGECP